jgi:hypothetical protein
MVKCNTSLLTPREKRSIVRGVNKKYKDRNLTDEDMNHMIEEAMAAAIRYRGPKRVYSIIQTKRRVPGSVVRETELKCAEDFIPLSTNEGLKNFLEEEGHCSAFEIETSSEDKTTGSETGSVEAKGDGVAAEDEGVEEKVSTSGMGGSQHDSSQHDSSQHDSSDEECYELPQPSSEDSSVEAVQESDSDSDEDLDEGHGILGIVRRFCCGRR